MMYKTKGKNKENIGFASTASQGCTSNKLLLPQYTQGNLQDYMQILFNFQKQSQKQGKYMEAQMAKEKLVQLKTELQKQRKGDIAQRHQSQKRQFHGAHIEQMSQFNKFWDERMIEYQKQAQRLQDQTLERHQQEMTQFQQRINQSTAFKPKESAEILNLKKIQQSLAKQENYMQAFQVQKQIQQLQRKQQQKWSYNNNSKAKNLIMQLMTKQENEVNALRQRIQQGFEQQKKIRCIQEQKLIQKYKNFIKELQSHHTQQLQKLQKSAKMQSTINFSRRSNMSSKVSQASQKY